MPLYDVHIYPVCRLKVSGIEANSPEEAARKAYKATDFYAACPQGVEYAEDIEGLLVDPLNNKGERIADGINLSPDVLEE